MHARHSILAAELVESRGYFLVAAAGILRDFDVGKLLCAAVIAYGLLYYNSRHARLVVSCAHPLAVSETERLFGELVSMPLEVGARDNIQYIAVGEPQMPRPHDGTAFVLDGDDGIAVLDLFGRNVEVNKRVGTCVGYR